MFKAMKFVLMNSVSFETAPTRPFRTLATLRRQGCYVVADSNGMMGAATWLLLAIGAIFSQPMPDGARIESI